MIEVCNLLKKIIDPMTIIVRVVRLMAGQCFLIIMMLSRIFLFF